MPFGIIRSAVVALLLIALQGCVTKQSLPELPSALGEKGLLVARIHVLGMSAMGNAEVNVDGKFIPSGMRDGYVAIPLEAGDHKLVQLRVQGMLLASSSLVEDTSPIRQVKGGGGGGGGTRYIYVPGTSYTINYTSLGVDRGFRIEAGKVTNLGLIVYVPVLEDPNKKRATVNNSREFTVVALDNSAEINRFLDVNYPELVGNLTDRTIHLAPANYLDKTRLPNLRRVIAYYESFGPHVLRDESKTVVYGVAGTIAVLKKGGDDKASPVDVEMLDSGTLADIVGAAQSGQKLTFLTSDGKLLTWESGKLTEAALPFKVHPAKLAALGSTGLVAVDNRLRVMTSRYPGDAWASYEGAMVKNPRSDLAVVSDGDGAYISLGYRGLPESIYYLEAGEQKPQALPIPSLEGKSSISNMDFNYLVARDAGLFMMFNKADFLFWSKAKKNWNVHSMPPGKCKPLSFDSQGENLKVECDGMAYSSSDSGLTWAKPAI